MNRTGDPQPGSTSVHDLAARAERLAASGRRTLLGIVGAPGAGKSTVCQALVERLGDRCVVVGMDGFHLADEVLVTLGRRQRKGAPDTFDVGGYVSLLRRLRRADEDVVYAPRFDRALEAAIAGVVPVPRTVPLVISEGNYLLHGEDGWQAVRPLLHQVWFLDVPDEVRTRRLLARRASHGDTEEGARDWVARVDQANADIVVGGRDAADLVVTLA